MRRKVIGISMWVQIPLSAPPRKKKCQKKKKEKRKADAKTKREKTARERKIKQLEKLKKELEN